METLRACPVCGNTDLKDLFACKDFVATGEQFTLQRCNHCSFLFTNPRPTAAEIGRYYQSNKYVSHAGDKSGFMYKVYDVVRDYSILTKLKLIKSYQSSGRLMDLGCGLGYFLEGVTKDKTFDAVGVDVSDEAIEFVRKMFGIEVKNEAELDMFGPMSFDVITQWHVLEHVHNLEERMKQLKYLLKPTGTMFIAVPNSDSWDAEKYGPHWDGYDVPRHLYHFNRKSFTMLMENHGFKVKEIKPMLFDAPYISMRSEVHRNKSLPFVRGAISGAWSTIKALSSNDYSSLLFVVQHGS